MISLNIYFRFYCRATLCVLSTFVLICCNSKGNPSQKPEERKEGEFKYEDKPIEGLELDERTEASEITLNLKDEGYRGIWDHNGVMDNEYRYKYSGGLGTYSAKHRPFAIYDKEANKTFFCYGGATSSNNEHLLHMVSYYDHESGTVPKPTVLLDKLTGDAHDNPVISLDDDGYIWIFSTAHGSWRPSYVHKSRKPHDIDEFDMVSATKIEGGNSVPMDNFSYWQVWHINNRGFISFFSSYGDGGGKIVGPHGNPAQRTICYATSKTGKDWSQWITLGAIGEGHYQISSQTTGKAGTAFNFHPLKKLPEKGLNFRTNLYYMETLDFGDSWQAADGSKLKIPLNSIDNLALVHDYQSEGLLVYLKDIAYDENGYPAILYVTSKGYEPGPKNGPRTWRLAKWDGEEWRISTITTSDHNYDMGSIYIESSGIWRVLAPALTGPQPYNPGGEIGIWVSNDNGENWILEKQITQKSKYNHTYVRKPLYTHNDFYAFWADGHARKPSDSHLYFSDRNGRVYQLPSKMQSEKEKPSKIVNPIQ